jgi:dynein heavy chain, axonemal
VPTFDSIRYKFVKKFLLENRKHVLCPGPTGTGKTVNINSLLNQEMSEEFSAIPMMFSAQTSANQTQDTLDEKFEKRRKGVFGPPTGKKWVIFIDDLNMPKKEEYGAQPPIELIRQWMDHEGWYDLKTKEKEFKSIVDIIFCSAMGPPGGGRSSLTQRLQRHYNIINYTTLDTKSIDRIFVTILTRFLGSFPQEISENVEKLVEATQFVYDKVEKTLKPTPTKSHYTFNLRDMSKIF